MLCTLWHSRKVPWRWGAIYAGQWSPGNKPWHWRLFLAFNVGEPSTPFLNSSGYYGRHGRRFVAILFTPVLVWQTHNDRKVGLYLFGWCLYVHAQGPKT